jgi:NOL1/NOP2/sun family putative RNA methylase
MDLLADPVRRYRSIVDDAAAFEAALRRPLPRFVWTNTLRTTAGQLEANLAAEGYAPEPLPWQPAAFRITGRQDSLGRLWCYRAGHFQIQEASSMLPVLLLKPRPGQRILDLCAAPGSKMSQLAVALGNRGTVVANDLVGGRMKPVRMHIDRLGLLNVSITCHDGASYPKSAGLFDAVLVDAPCSCEGTSRKNPDVFQRPVAHRRRLLQKQVLLLQQALRRCRAGGRIVYSTCTYDPEENEAVVDTVLERMPGQARVLPAHLPGVRTAAGLTAWNGRTYRPELQHTLRIWPHLNDTGGFYLALLEKAAPGSQSPEDPPAVSDPAFTAAGTGAPAPFADGPRIVEQLAQRFGMARQTFDGICFLTRNGREIYAVACDHRPPLKPVYSTGLPLIHMGMRNPKLTTAGAVHFGSAARRNVVDLDRRRLEQYLLRQPLRLTDRQCRGCTDNGYVLVGHRGAVVGVGDYRQGENALISYYPKRLSAAAD